VGHLAPGLRSTELERFFKEHGFSKSIVEVAVKEGYGFVNFDDRQDADDAIYELNGKELMGSRIQVEYAKPSGRSGGSSSRSDYGRRDSRDDRGGRDRDRDRDRDRRGSGGGRPAGPSRFGTPYNTEFKVCIDNVSTRCSWQDIKDYFRQAGEVTFAQCHRDRMGQGVVEFASARDMKNAIKKLDGTELFSKKIRLTAKYRGSPSCSRSRSRSPVVHQRRSPPTRRSPSPRRRSPSPRRRSISRSRSRSP